MSANTMMQSSLALRQTRPVQLCRWGTAAESLVGGPALRAARVSPDVCDFPEDMPRSIIEGLGTAKRSGCVPLLFFTNAWHDGNRDWWAGTAMGPFKGQPKHKAVEGRGHRLPHTAIFDNAAFAAFDHVPSTDDISHLNGLALARLLLLHAEPKKLKTDRLEEVLERALRRL